MECLRPLLNLFLRTLLIITYLYIPGCLEFESIQQPSSILPNELFSVLVEVAGDGPVYSGSWVPTFGICLPTGLTIPGDTIEFTGVSQGAIFYDPNLSLPAPEGYYWWIGRGLWFKTPDTGEVFAEITMQADLQPGLYSLEYLLHEGPSYYGLGDAERSDRYIIEVVDEWTPRGLSTSSQGSSIVLAWLPPLKKEGLAGYHVYRDGEILNAEPFTDSEYSDQDLPGGVFHYSVSSLYENGEEHIISNEIKAIIFSEGTGEPNAPYQVTLAEQLVAIAEFPDLLDQHFVLNNNIDLDPNLQTGRVFNKTVIPRFSGTFDGQGYEIQHLSIDDERTVSQLGLFGVLASGGEVSGFGITDVNIIGSNPYVAGLVGKNYGELKSCYVTGVITCSLNKYPGNSFAGGLVSTNYGSITSSYSSGAVSGEWNVGGLVAGNTGSITNSYSTGLVDSNSFQGSAGGLVGLNSRGGSIFSSYSTGSVSGDRRVGGLVGRNSGSIVSSYSTSRVSGDPGGRKVGGLVGDDNQGIILASFWDIHSSVKTTSEGGIGLTTPEMQTATTFLEAGWDFIDENANGTEDIWWIDEGKDYPRLWWELIPDN